MCRRHRTGSKTQILWRGSSLPLGCAAAPIIPIGYADPLGLAVDPLIKLKDRGYTGVTKTPGGGLDYSESNALYNKKPGVNPIVRIEYTGDYGKDFEAANKAAKLSQKTTPSGHVWHHLDDYDPKTNRHYAAHQAKRPQRHKP